MTYLRPEAITEWLDSSHTSRERNRADGVYASRTPRDNSPRLFQNTLLQYNFEGIRQQILATTARDVASVIAKAAADHKLSVGEFACLLSPAATAYLEQLAALSQRRTQQRFGKTLQLYIPLYLSNYCTNNCVYCGFNAKNNIKRVALTNEEILQEVVTIKSMGYDHILLVTGENHKKAGVDYILNAIKLVRPMFSSISAEIQPLQTADYQLLIEAGLNSVYIYQETYNAEKYGTYHPIGQKSDFAFRLQTPERLGDAGIHRIGLGALLGLEDWRAEAYCLALHLRFMQKHYWKTKYSISFPRIRPNQGGFQPNHIVSDKDLAQLIWAFRLFDEDVEMALSTRESPNFRNNMMALGITSISAGSKTEPGGYSHKMPSAADSTEERNSLHSQQLEQFEVNDNRSPAELIAEINRQNYTAVWKDWDRMFGN